MHGVKRERILRVLLNRPDGSLTKYRVAKLSGCSIAWTMTYLKKLELEGYVKKTKTISVERLMDLWTTITQEPRHFDFFLNSPLDLLRGIDKDYALTTYQAENLVNHYLFPSRVDIYVREEDLLVWKESVTAKSGLTGKGNLRLLIYDPHVFYEKKMIDGLWVASLPQVMVDLKREGGVCMEAYEMMVENYVRQQRD